MLEYTFNQKSDKALNGQEAVDRVNQRLADDKENPCVCSMNNNCYKIIFMDCQMPVMDGFQSTIEIKKLEQANNF